MVAILFLQLSFVTTAISLINAADFVKRNGKQFVYKGQKFAFGGANNYYIPYSAPAQVEDVFASAKEMKIPVIRTWAFAVAGDPKNKNWPPITAKDPLSTYFHYWNGTSGSSKFNEGSNGLKKLDYALKKAADYGVKLILVLTNNWGEYGGSEQMNLWYGVKYHDDFFTYDKTKMEYKKWVNYLLNRKNPLKGNIMYKDDPDIFAWELINEIRCKGCANIGTCKECPKCKAANPSCTAAKVTAWVSEMAKYVKSIDRNHLIGVGDEGFLNRRSTKNEWGYNGEDGDTEQLIKIPEIDFGTVHTYPDAWKDGAGKPKSEQWTTQWIDDHIEVAHRNNKAFIMEEFGWQVYGEKGNQDRRNGLYDKWAKQICMKGGNWMFWMLGARQVSNENDKIDGKGLYPDYDNYTIYHKNKDGAITLSGQKMQDRVRRTKEAKC